MKTNLIFVRIGGIMNLLAAVLHMTFWETFNWTEQLSQLSTINSNIMQMLNLFVTVFFIYVGLLLLLRPKSIVSTSMGKHFLGMLLTLWSARLAMEFYFPAADWAFAGVLAFTILCFAYPLFTSIKVKGKLDASEHQKHNWLVHQLLDDFEIEDVWALPIEMNGTQSVGDVLRTFTSTIDEISQKGIAGLLFKFRFFLGRVFGWDDEVDPIDTLPVGSIRERYARQEGLDASEFTIKPGAQFIPVYQTKNEALSEIENQTVHAAVHYGKVPMGNDDYTVHMTVYVKPKGLFGKMYMQLILPFRLFIVYPIMLGMMGNLWKKQQEAVSEQDLIMTGIA